MIKHSEIIALGYRVKTNLTDGTTDFSCLNDEKKSHILNLDVSGTVGVVAPGGVQTKSFTEIEKLKSWFESFNK